MIDEDADHSAVPGKGNRSALVQVAAAVALGAGVVGGMWGLGLFENPPAQNGKPASCNPPKATDSPEYPALCAALNRPDLPQLLGVPAEHVSVAQSGGGPTTLADGTKQDDASAEVQVGTVNVRIADNRDLAVRDFAALLSPRPEPASVLGHPSVSYSDHTVAIVFNGGSPRTGTGGIARHLVVAKDPEGGGGSVEIAVWRQDDAAPDDAALLRVAQQVLPTLPGWVARP